MSELKTLLHSRNARLIISVFAFFLTFGVYLGFAQEATKVDPKIPSYTKVSGMSGNINSIGSDSMNNLMTLWCEGFNKFYPNVRTKTKTLTIKQASLICNNLLNLLMTMILLDD